MITERNAVEEFIYDTCMTLDEKDFDGFMRMCDPKFSYMLTAYSPEIKKDMIWLDHNWAEMNDLFKTLPKHNSDQNPLTRNVTVYKVNIDQAKKQAQVVSSFQIYKTALDGGTTELFAVGKYFDTVSLGADKPLLLNRHVKLDTRSLGWGYHIPF